VKQLIDSLPAVHRHLILVISTQRKGLISTVWAVEDNGAAKFTKKSPEKFSADADELSRVLTHPLRKRMAPVTCRTAISLTLLQC
jgi:hypothetical protein